MIKKFGFTLAEVLITLGIIGVVAAMTIPTLMQKTNDSELKSGYKKMISVINQAISMNYALDGVDFSNISSAAGSPDDEKGTSWLGFVYRRLNVVGSDGNVIYFSDGSSVDLSEAITDGDCTKDDPCKVIIDVNGRKGPNQMTTQTTNLHDQYTVYAYGRQFSPTDSADDPGNYILKN